MNKKIIIIILALSLLIPSINANLEINPQSFSIETFSTTKKSKDIDFRNTNNFTIYNITFTDNQYITFPQIDKLEPNETRTVNLTFLTDTTFDQNFQIVTKFLFFTDVLIPTKTYNVTITDSQFDPIEITIKKGDSVRWKNNDTRFHTITSVNRTPVFDHTINEGETRTLTFDKIEEISYKDNNLGYFGKVIVENKSLQLANNPDFNEVMSITINSKLESSQINLSALETDFTVKHNESGQGILEIKNIGNKTLVSLDLTSDKWVSFRENDFNLDPDKEKLIIFDINPSITSSNETNKTHTLTITAKADNSGEKQTTINVNIPFSPLVEFLGNKSREELAEELRNLKPLLEEALKQLEQGTPEPEIIYQDTLIGVNLTEADLFNALGRISDIETKLDTDVKFDNNEINNIKTTLENVNSNLQIISTTSNESLTLSQENRESIDSMFSFLFFLVIVIVILTGGGIFAFYLLKNKKGEREALGD